VFFIREKSRNKKKNQYQSRHGEGDWDKESTLASVFIWFRQGAIFGLAKAFFGCMRVCYDKQGSRPTVLDGNGKESRPAELDGANHRNDGDFGGRGRAQQQ
jgi:hypothetical protein